jgi:hypothetical protein
MTDVVVTCPQWFWEEWIEEGALPGEACPPDEEYHFYLGGPVPRIRPGERVYVVALGKLRGYAPLVRIEPAARTQPGHRGFALVRQGGAQAVTIPAPIRGFRGWQYRWWDQAEEVAFPDWRRP